MIVRGDVAPRGSTVFPGRNYYKLRGCPEYTWGNSLEAQEWAERAAQELRGWLEVGEACVLRWQDTGESDAVFVRISKQALGCAFWGAKGGSAICEGKEMRRW